MRLPLSDCTDFPKLSLLQLPVPVFLPDPTGKSMKESIQPDLQVQDERTEREDRVVTKEEQRGETHTPKGKDEHEGK